MSAAAAAWAGLGLAIFDLLVWFVLAFGLARLWAKLHPHWEKLRPQVEPLLSMFLSQPPPPTRETTETVRSPYGFGELRTSDDDEELEG